MPGEFTCLHTDYLKLCLVGRFYTQAMPMINMRLTSVRPYYRIDPEEQDPVEPDAGKAKKPEKGKK